MKICGRARLVCVSFTMCATLGAAATAVAQTEPTASQASPVVAQASSSLTQITPPIAQDRDASSARIAELPSGRIFGHLLQDSFGDFRRLASKENATWLALGAAIALYSHTMDRPVSQGMGGVAALERPFGPGDRLGAGAMQLGGAFATYAIGHLAGKPRVAQVGSDLLRAQIITKTMTTGLKVAFNRTRPDGTPYSFPSGHSSAAFASATVLQRNFGWKVGIPAYGVASYIAASRLQEKKHFLSDIAFGAAIGIVAGRTVTVGRGQSRFVLAPVAVPGGAAVSFSLAPKP
jgi:membrane-associated phospholipid phosphatase